MNTSQSESIDALAAALAEAQGELEFAIKDSQNPHFKNTYASLAAVIDAVRPAFSRHGLSFTQEPVNDGELIGLRTTLIHKSGQWRSSAIFLKVGRPGPQEAGSTLTYLRRYALAAVAGIAQDDDDGETAHDRPSKQTAKPASAPGLATRLQSECAAAGITTAKDFAELCRRVIQKDRPNDDAERQRLIDAILEGQVKA